MTDFPAQPGSDPYRYGPPPAPVGAAHPTGKQILTASWRLLKRDRGLLVLPLLGAVSGFVAFVILFVPGALIGLSGDGDPNPAFWVFAVLGVFAASVATIFFQAALVAGVYQRADGQDPTVAGTLAVAWQLRGRILGWAVLTTVVGTLMRVLEERLGIFGRIVGFLGGIAWAIASFFVVPVIVAEGLGPVEALKRSAATIRNLWGTSVRTTLRFGLLQVVLTLVPMLLLFGGAVAAASSADSDSSAGVVVGVLVALVGGVSLIALGIVFSAISTYARSLIYRWATGRPVPGLDPALFAGAFAAKRRWRG